MVEAFSASGCWHAESVSVGKPIVSVAAAALVDSDGRLLLSRRRPEQSMSGLWEFPGGKIETSETPEAALIRELEEELSITTRHSCLAPLGFASHAYADFHLLLLLYVCRIWQGIVQANEGQAVKWVAVRDLRHYPQPLANQPLNAILRDLL